MCLGLPLPSEPWYCRAAGTRWARARKPRGGLGKQQGLGRPGRGETTSISAAGGAGGGRSDGGAAGAALGRRRRRRAPETAGGGGGAPAPAPLHDVPCYAPGALPCPTASCPALHRHAPLRCRFFNLELGLAYIIYNIFCNEIYTIQIKPNRCWRISCQSSNRYPLIRRHPPAFPTKRIAI